MKITAISIFVTLVASSAAQDDNNMFANRALGGDGGGKKASNVPTSLNGGNKGGNMSMMGGKKGMSMMSMMPPIDEEVTFEECTAFTGTVRECTMFEAGTPTATIEDIDEEACAEQCNDGGFPFFNFLQAVDEDEAVDDDLVARPTQCVCFQKCTLFERNALASVYAIGDADCCDVIDVEFLSEQCDASSFCPTIAADADFTNQVTDIQDCANKCKTGVFPTTYLGFQFGVRASGDIVCGCFDSCVPTPDFAQEVNWHAFEQINCPDLQG